MMRLRGRTLGPLLIAVAAAAVAPSAHAQLAQQGPKLVGTGAVDPAYQGRSVALSADGNTAFVGGVNDNSSAGAAWVWTRSGGVWTLQGPKLVGTGAVRSAQQGQSVALSGDGNTALVGGPADDGLAGAVWVWTQSGGVWSQQGSKLVGTGTDGPASQGWSVALSADGSTALVGGPGDNGAAGAVWVWTLSGGVWGQQGPKLVGAGAVESPFVFQGQSVALSGDGNTALVGGPADNGSVGAAWVWTRSGGVWTQQGPKLVGTGAVGNANQGDSVALSADGNTALVGGPGDNYNSGGPGAVWVWTRSGGVWTQQGPKLAGTGAVGGPFVYQGSSVALSADGNAALVGATNDDGGVGAVWVWARSGDVWAEQGPKLVGAGAVGVPVDQGISVALSADGNTALVGGDEDNGSAGAAWVFVASPVVTTNPVNQIVIVGSNATFKAAATGAPTLTVQWEVSTDNGIGFSDIPGATSSTYTFPATASQNGNQYRAVFTNSVGSATSSAATLTVGVPTLSVQKTHNESFTQGQTGVWAISVGNVGTANTAGTVAVSDTLPPGYSFTSFTGADWTCSSAGLSSVSCVSSDVVTVGSSLPVLSLTVNVPATSPTSVQNTASASGGGALNSAVSNTDTVTVTQVPSQLAFKTQPPTYPNIWQALSPAVVVQIQDAAGNLVPGSSTATVSISSTPPGVSGTLTVNAVGGVATFSDLSFTVPANYTLTATSMGLASANSTNISLNHLRDFAGTGRSGALLYDPVVGTAYTALSNGDGTYQYVYNLFTPAFDTLRTGDFNGDGKADLVLYNSQTALAYIGLGNGEGTFSFQSLFWSPGYDFVEPGDLNGDGKTDFALYNSSTGTLYTGISDGTGGFTYKYTLISQGFTFVRLADFAGDGKAGLFVYNAANGVAFLGIGDGAGGFAFHPQFMSPGYDLIDAGDLNGDGKADIIVYNSTTGNAATGIGDGVGGFAFTPMIFSPGFTSVRLADYGGDGLADVTAYNKTNAAAYFGTGTGLGTFNFSSLFWSPGYDFVEPEDVNGDGRVDIVLYNSATGTEYTGISNSTGGFTYTYSLWGLGKILAR